MCLALPVRIDSLDGDEAWGTLGDAKIRVSLVMTPEAGVGDWVLVHAGFAIQQVTEADAAETWRLAKDLLEAPE